MQASEEDEYRDQIMTLEAFADTFVPGEKRYPDDKAIAGAAAGPGAVAAGAIELLQTPATGVSEGLPGAAQTLNEHARTYAASHSLDLDPAVPAFVALEYASRRALLTELTTPGHPEKDIWILVALFCFMAFDTAAHLHTTDAIAAGHPGLVTMDFAKPDDDGLWRFPDYSYGRQLARIHPGTTSAGNPA
jgi:enediyne biosynthesis protein E8